jgi:hypothetical protein
MSYDAQHWRRRAEEMRKIADDLTLFERAQATLLHIAEEFDRKALQVEERRRSEISAA